MIRLSAAAREAIAEEQRVACARYGHPPVVLLDFGYVYCARCKAQIGDVLGSVFNTEHHAVIGHDCGDCADTVLGLTEEQRYLTPTCDVDYYDPNFCG